jgi:hypothetical protein
MANYDRVFVKVGNKFGRSAKGPTPGHVTQHGYAIGDHITEKREGSGYRGEPRFGAAPHNAGQQLGNAWAAGVKCGVGGGATVYKSGSQHSLPPARDVPAGRDILNDYGPNYKR